MQSPTSTTPSRLPSPKPSTVKKPSSISNSFDVPIESITSMADRNVIPLGPKTVSILTSTINSAKGPCPEAIESIPTLNITITILPGSGSLELNHILEHLYVDRTSGTSILKGSYRISNCAPYMGAVLYSNISTGLPKAPGTPP